MLGDIYVPELLTVSEDSQETNPWRLPIRTRKKLSKPKPTQFPSMLRSSAGNAKSQQLMFTQHWSMTNKHHATISTCPRLRYPANANSVANEQHGRNGA